MCFSLEIDKNIKKLAKRFSATPIKEEFIALKDLQALESRMGRAGTKEALGLKRKPSSQFFKIPEENGRIYPNYFAPVIKMNKNKREIVPMRYRLRPRGSKEEIPTKFNVFNARVDSLEKRSTWSNIFMKNHGVFPFKKFYEWVSDESGRKRMISFSPSNYEIMWAPCLYDIWENKNSGIKFFSFAIITDDPPQEILDRGHDRCPIFLEEDKINHWLSPENQSRDSVYEVLKQKTEAKYCAEWEGSC